MSRDYQTHWQHTDLDLCAQCGKYHKHNKIYVEWFDTMDGGDYMDQIVCWKCEMYNNILHHLHQIKKKKYLKQHLRRKNIIDYLTLKDLITQPKGNQDKKWIRQQLKTLRKQYLFRKEL